MKIAVISDVHANLEALREVLGDIDRLMISDIVCLGDNIGYGPHPAEVVRVVNQRGIPCVMGNHELAMGDKEYMQWLNPVARKSLAITRTLLPPVVLGYVTGLKKSMSAHGAHLVHGVPPDEVTTYLFDLEDSQLPGLFDSFKEQICFVGHTHELAVVEFDGETAKRDPLEQGLYRLVTGHRYIINVGSVGQPRDGNNCAKYVIWYKHKNYIDVRFVPYDARRTADHILKRGMPEQYAERLL